MERTGYYGLRGEPFTPMLSGPHRGPFYLRIKTLNGQIRSMYAVDIGTLLPIRDLSQDWYGSQIPEAWTPVFAVTPDVDIELDEGL